MVRLAGGGAYCVATRTACYYYSSSCSIVSCYNIFGEISGFIIMNGQVCAVQSTAGCVITLCVLLSFNNDRTRDLTATGLFSARKASIRLSRITNAFTTCAGRPSARVANAAAASSIENDVWSVFAPVCPPPASSIG